MRLVSTGRKERRRLGASYKLAFVILLGTINSFTPVNMWTLTSDYFSFSENPWYYIIGIVSIGFAARNIYVLKKMPQKPKVLEDGNKTVW